MLFVVLPVGAADASAQVPERVRQVMTERVQVGGLQVAKVLYDFVVDEAIPGTGVDAAEFWAGADKVIHDLAPRNRALLATRDELQAQIDT